MKMLLPITMTALFSLALGLAAQAAEPVNSLTNGGFEKDLTGWTTEGDASIETSAPLEGKGSLRLGPGKSAVRQKYEVKGLRIIWFGANLRPDPTTTAGLVRARCLDSKGHVLLDLTQAFDPKKTGEKKDEVGLYFKTHAYTTALEVSIEKPSAEGILYADRVALVDYDKDRKPDPEPTCNLEQYMEPIWRGKTVYNETVLLVSEGGKPASGTLLFTPTKILSVQDHTLTASYSPNVDYTLNGRTITCTPDSRLPMVKDSELPAADRKDFPWYDVMARQVVVTYTHEDHWSGPLPGYQGSRLPRTLRKLSLRQPLKIVAYGDSITLGMDVSGYLQVAPYMPTWADLFGQELKRRFGSDVRVYNAGLGGMTSAWGKENAESVVASLEPDLVIIAFGMNDFWSISGEAFRANVKAIMDTVRARQPEAEFVLISSMHFDPAYTSDPKYTGTMASYPPALESLAGDGVAHLDMDAISRALYAVKKPKDLISNPMHPTDFLGRWYAQGLVAAVDRKYGR